LFKQSKLKTGKKPVRNVSLKLKKFHLMLNFLEAQKSKEIFMTDLRAQFIFNGNYFKDYLNEFILWSKQYGKNYVIRKGTKHEKFLVIK